MRLRQDRSRERRAVDPHSCPFGSKRKTPTREAAVFSRIEHMVRIKFARRTLVAAAYLIVALTFLAASTRAGKRNERVSHVVTVRVPNAGIQPQVAIDDRGVLHLVYFGGEAAH